MTSSGEERKIKPSRHYLSLFPAREKKNIQESNEGKENCPQGEYIQKNNVDFFSLRIFFFNTLFECTLSTVPFGMA